MHGILLRCEAEQDVCAFGMVGTLGDNVETLYFNLQYHFYQISVSLISVLKTKKASNRILGSHEMN